MVLGISSMMKKKFERGGRRKRMKWKRLCGEKCNVNNCGFPSWKERDRSTSEGAQLASKPLAFQRKAKTTTARFDRMQDDKSRSAAECPTKLKHYKMEVQLTAMWSDVEQWRILVKTDDYRSI